MEKLVDKNQLIGIVLLMCMWAGYMYFMPQTPPEQPAKVAQKTEAKTIATPNVSNDTTALKAAFGDFASAAVGTAQDIVIENQDAKFTFNTLGGSIKEAVLKNYSTYADFQKGTKNPLVLFDSKSSNMSLEVQTNKGKVDLKKLYFTSDSKPTIVKEGDSTKVSFRLNLGQNQYIEQVYTIKGQGYTIDYDLNFVGVDALVQNQPVRFFWQDNLKVLEHDIAENRKSAQINYWNAKEDDFDDLGANSAGNADVTLEDPIKWFSFKQKYFVTGFVSKNQPLSGAKLRALTPENSQDVVKTVEIDANLAVSDLKTGKGNFRFYFGPNDYDLVKVVADGFHRNVYLGYDFVKPINRFIFVPLFKLAESFISNYGLLIIVVVLVLKTILTPLIYKSYISSAKMRILAPELAIIKEKVGDDQVKMQQEQMKLYQQVGVNPLSGCVPMLLQMPILMSVFFLFPNMVMFRQKNFLWASDLSTYDYPISWATNLPLIGNHISLFVVLMTISSLAFTYYNNQITPDQPGPIDMKKMSYVFPLVFFFVLNSFPAALSFYYLVSNVVTIAQQQIVRRFVDEDKIRKILDENRTKFKSNPPKKGKFAQFMENQVKMAEENRKGQNEDKKKKK
ncbi:Membrane protein oxaA [Emticicia oligotrophica DSM 17448]|uniref:Membrane protein insertase YidC n=1 Tax=Emticicia oligotrophica (strain DSM 17448 / CIP 109782 / MTCC 6937 / GPTSA100-15) TaxID=929562 RepID=A0ABM5MXM9_EMTOG|nr:membrane protein insertase YidC [Emticicia oligotrophica]AFK01869.1 Membrane protein oxaA [Emticicia oligotrophica DSM 17448]